MVKIEKYLILRVENPLNLGSQQFYKIFKVLQYTQVVPNNTESNTCYLNNCIN